MVNSYFLAVNCENRVNDLLRYKCGIYIKVLRHFPVFFSVMFVCSVYTCLSQSITDNMLVLLLLL